MTDGGAGSEMKIIKTVCSTCHCCCGVLAYVKDGKVVKVEGDPEHPNNRGGLCPKGVSGIDLLYHPDRLNYPLKRVGEKGQGNWERITWDEALDTIAKRLSAIKIDDGPEAIGITRGGGIYGNIGIIGYFAYLLGTPNTMASSFICFQPHVAAVHATIGYSEAIHATEVVSAEAFNSKCILLWAANPKASSPYPLGEGIPEIQAKGAKLIVVDPCPTSFAKKADIWLQIRPDTDDALALGMIHVIVNEKLYDHEFVDKYTYGFDALKEHIQRYTPEKVAQITWAPVEKIIDAARLFAATRPGCIIQRVPLDQNCNAVQTSRAILILNAICGNLDKQGGNLLPREGIVTSDTPLFRFVNKLPQEVLKKRIGAERLPLLSGPGAPPANVHPDLWAKAILTGKPYPIKAQITSARNWLIGDQNARVIEQAFRKLEFSVTMDLFMTPTAELSDIVLPAVSWLERDGLRGHPGYPYVTPVQHKAVEPLYERWDDIKFFIELAKRMSLDIPWDSVDGYMNFKMENMDVSFSELQGQNYISLPKEYDRHTTGVLEFKTPSKKVEIYSTLLESKGYDPLPNYVLPPETTKDFPLILMGGKKQVEYVHTAGRQIEKLRERVPEPIIEMHPMTARQSNVEDGDWVWIETIYFGTKERVRYKTKLNEQFSPHLVAVNHGWWFPESTVREKRCFESNINVVIPSDVFDPMFGCTNLRSIPCRIYKE